MFYSLLLFTHNLVRWLVLITAIWSLVGAYRGWFAKHPWTDSDRRAGLAFSIVYDVQLLLGLLLAFLSPLVRAALADPSAAMTSSELRFFLIEHIPVMVIGLAAVHITSALARKAPDDQGKHRRAAIGYTLATLLTLVAIPWSRPLIRGIR
ncbi:MAG: hypothetical protein GTO14_10115 [Anaerolineales bacterium]|nr:hypothetical protein [Anaerolineales bacterium]